MNRRKLHLQADRIEMVLVNHKAPGRVTGGRVTPRTIQFHIQLAASTKVRKLEALSEDIALALGAPSARVSRSNGHINVEVPRRDSGQKHLTELCDEMLSDAKLLRALRVPGTALLGMDAEGVPLMVRLASPDVTHILIAGSTGSGKSEALKTILASLVVFQRPREIQLLLVDSKGSVLRVFDGLPHVLTNIIRSVDETSLRLRWLVGEMERRQIQSVVMPRIIVGIDELGDLLLQGGREMHSLLARIVQRGRSAGISVVACTQKPTAAAIGSLVKGNFPVRLVGKVTSADDARVASGVGGTGAEKLAGRGDFVLVAGGQVIRFQVAYLPETDYAAFHSKVLRPARSGTQRLGGRGLLARLTGRAQE